MERAWNPLIPFVECPSPPPLWKVQEMSDEISSFLISSGPLSSTTNYQVIVRGNGAINSKMFEILIRQLQIDLAILAECELEEATSTPAVEGT